MPTRSQSRARIIPNFWIGIVEYYKNRLWHKPEQKQLVDFLDEAVRRFSAVSPEGFMDVRMKGVNRRRKVRVSFYFTNFHLIYNSFNSGVLKRHAILIVNGPMMKSERSIKVSELTGEQKCALYRKT